MVRRNRTLADAGTLVLAASILFTGALTSVAAVPTHAAGSVATAQSKPWKNPDVSYVALGDSYAAGQGAGSYENACMQSSLSYPERLDDIKHVKLIADASCSGATTRDVLVQQLSVVRKNKNIGLVTVTVGANDLGGTGVVAACAASISSPECRAALDAAYALMTPQSSTVPSRLALRLTAALGTVAATAPRAKILVTGYPYLFETPPATDPNYAAIAEITKATAALNTTIASVAQRLARVGVDIRYVDVTAAFAGHGIGSPDPWINAAGSDAFHPNAAGYLAYAKALQPALLRR